MTEKEKEFEVQKALGLAGEYFLIITTTSMEPQVHGQKIKEAVEKHTFVSKCIAEEVNYPYSKYTAAGGYEVVQGIAGPVEIILTFCVKCVHGIKNRIITEFQHTSYEINIELKACPRLFDMDPITIDHLIKFYN